METNPTMQTTRVFQRNYEMDKRIVINRWGTRSSKTYSILQLILFWLLFGKIDNTWKHFEDWICTIVRKQKSTIKQTALRDREEIIANSWVAFLLNKEHRNMTDKTYKYKWRVVEFIWADDQQKLRWWKRDILYCNEANELSYTWEFFQLMMRTTYKIIIDFNPDNEYIWINTELEQKRQYDEWDVWVIVSTYKDNPFLPDLMIKEIERLEKTNPQFWKIYGLWEYGKLEGIVFPNRKVIEDIPKDAELVWHGIDFGFTNDPSTITSVYRLNDSIIIDEVMYEYWKLPSEIAARIISLDMNKYDSYIWDSASPAAIEEIYRSWINIKPVTKYKDSIQTGISIVNSYKILITSRSQNVIREFKSYTYDKDKNGNFMNKPIDEMNHAIDWVRYVCMEKLWQKARIMNAPRIRVKY